MIDEFMSLEISTGAFTCLMIVSAIGTLLAFLLAYWATWAWWWMDDFEGVRPRNPLTVILMNALGHSSQWNSYSERWEYKNRKGVEVDPDSRIMSAVAFAFVFPLTLKVFLLWPSIPMVLGLGVVVMFMGRTGRRYKKLFDKHVADPEAHRRQGGEDV